MDNVKCISIFYLMPKSNQSQYIVDDYVSDSIGTNVFAKELFAKYTPCNPKFLNQTKTKMYIKGKLDRAITDVKYKKKSVDDDLTNTMTLDIWKALCPILDTNEDDIPSELFSEIKKIVNFKTKSFTKMKKMKFKAKQSENESSESEEDSEDDSESESESEPEPEPEPKKSKNKKESKKEIKKETKKTTKKVTKKKKEEPKEESSDDSESDSD